MLFNTHKSKVIHFAANNKEVDYFLGSGILRAVENGVIVDRTLKPSKQCVKAAGADNAVLGIIKHTFYKALVRL